MNLRDAHVNEGGSTVSPQALIINRAIVELSIIFFSGIGCDDYSFFDKNIFLFPRFAIKKKTIIKFHWTKRGMISP
jgi:hypothetical protein